MILLPLNLYFFHSTESLFALGPDELGRLEDKDKAESKVRVIPVHLQKLFARLLLLNQQSASTTELTDSFGWTNNEVKNSMGNRITYTMLILCIY